MRRRASLLLCASLAILGPAAARLPVNAADRAPCSGHELLSTPRPEQSCTDVKPRIYPSPDGALRALVFPADISLDATPDMESRVVLRTSKGNTLTSKSHSSPRGMDGYYVVTAKWSPDSQFFVYSLSSSGGHWSLALVVSDDGVWPQEECHRRFQRPDRRQSHSVGGFQFHRTA
jgi:hypothetical protein